MRGLLIAVCGLDGSGKTTQIEMLNKWLLSNEISCTVTKQPTDYYRQDERVRNYLDNGECADMNALALLAAADRRWHLATFIEPSINQGVCVITDRYLYSSLAYFKVRGIDSNYVKLLNGEIRIPDITVFLDIDPQITLQRVKTRDKEITKFEERNSGMFYKIRAAFKEILPEDALIMDGTLEPELIHETILKKVKQCLNAQRGVELEL